MSRRRRFWRVLVLVAAGLMVLLLVVAIGVRLYGSARLRAAERLFQAEVGPLDCAAYAPAAVPEERNAASLLIGGARAIVLSDDLKEKRLVSRGAKEPPPDDWSEPDLAALRAIVDRNAAALAVLRQARAYPAANLGIPYRQGTEAKLPNLLEAMDSARVLGAHAALAVMDGDLGRAADDVETLGAQARAYGNESVLIVLLIGMAMERQQLGTASLLVSSPDVDAATLERLRASLQRTDLSAAYRRALAFDSVSTYRIFRNPPPAQEYRLAFQVVGPLVAADMLERGRLWNAAFSRPGPEIQPFLAEHEDEDSLPFVNLFGSIPNIVNGGARATATVSQRRLAAAAIDLRLEALRTGRYPDALAAAHLQPEPFRGVPLRYERLPDGSAVVEVPGAAEAWNEIAARAPVRFRWTLPPPVPLRV